MATKFWKASQLFDSILEAPKKNLASFNLGFPWLLRLFDWGRGFLLIIIGRWYLTLGFGLCCGGLSLGLRLWLTPCWLCWLLSFWRFQDCPKTTAKATHGSQKESNELNIIFFAAVIRPTLAKLSVLHQCSRRPLVVEKWFQGGGEIWFIILGPNSTSIFCTTRRRLLTFLGRRRIVVCLKMDHWKWKHRSSIIAKEDSHYQIHHRPDHQSRT